MFETWEIVNRNHRLGDFGKADSEAAVKAAVTAGGCLQQWKQAGRPQDINFCSTVGGSATGGGLLTPHGGDLITMPAPDSQLPGTGASAAGKGGAMDGIKSFFAEIPSTYLFIGGAIVVFMMLKKR